MTTGTKDFLAAFYRGKGWLEIRILDIHGRSSHFKRSIDEALAAFDKWRPMRGADIYFGVCPRREEYRASLEDILCSYSVWVDIDAKSEDDRKSRLAFIQQFPLPPSTVVSSGNGFHVYWLLRKPTKKWVTFSKVIKAFEKMFEADTTGDRARVLRVPDTTNWKDMDNPLAVRIVEELTDLSRLYTLRDVALAPKLLDPELKLRHKIVTGDSRGFPSRSERDWNVMTTLVRLGFSDDAIRYIFAVHAIGDRARDDPAYFDRTLENARESRDPLGTPLNLVLKSKTDNVSTAPIEADDNDITDADAETELRDWGFEAGEDGFLYRTDGKEPRMVSTFVFEPTRLLKGDGDTTEDALLGIVRASGYTWPNETFLRSAFSRSDAMHRQLKIAAWQWLGSDGDVREYLPYLVSVLQAKGLPHTRAVPALGRYGDVWVTSDGALTATEVFDKTTAPKVLVTKTGNVVRAEYPFPPQEEQDTLKARVRELLPKINVPSAIWPMIGWFFATAYKPVLKSLNIRFPILNVWGTRGSGKTCTVTEIFLPLMGDVDCVSHECATTPFVLRTLLGAATSIPVAFFEFRQSAMRSASYQLFLHLLLQSYDTGRDSRGRPDLTVQQFPLTSPFSVDGEDMVADAAAQERIIAVNLEPETVEEGSPAHAAYDDLVVLSLRGLAGAYVRFTLAQDTRELWETATDLFQKAFPASLPNRVRSNYTVVVLGLLSYERFMNEPFEEGEFVQFVRRVLAPSLDSLLSPEGRTKLPIDEFIEDVVNAVGLHAANAFAYRYYPKDNALRFHLGTALNWWYSKRRREGGDALAEAAIKQQLKERQKEYVFKPKGVSVGGVLYWMHGVDIAKALAAGLDIPETLPPETEIIIGV